VSVDHHTYTVRWSAVDGESVATCNEFPSLSWSAQTPDEALRGIRRVVAASVADMRADMHMGSNVDDFLREAGIYGEVTAVAMHRVSECQAKQGRQL
jgi:hypothetical protein